ASMVVFVARISIPFLFAARFLTGLSIGLVAGASTAWIAELHPQQDSKKGTSIAAGTNLVGLGLGPLASGLLSQYAPWPLRLGYLVFLAGLVPMALVVARMRETVPHPVRRASEISLGPRLGVPREIRSR